jgi:hypothetical protein
MFDIDTTDVAMLGTVATESSAPYTVDFGTLDPTDSDVNVSEVGSGINFIHLDLSTNATNGAVVTIENANATNGMVSASDGVDNIANSATTMAPGTEAYGFCVGGVDEAEGATMTIGGAYSTLTCEAGENDNDIAALTDSTAPATLLTVSGPVSEGEAYLVANADASVLTEAHDDYVDTLTFIATATF